MTPFQRSCRVDVQGHDPRNHTGWIVMEALRSGPTLSEIVTETLRANPERLVQALAHNSLLAYWTTPHGAH